MRPLLPCGIFLALLWILMGHPCAADPAPSEAKPKIEALIQKLGDSRFESRERAYAELLRICAEDLEETLPHLPNGHPDPEIQTCLSWLRCDVFREAALKEAMRIAGSNESFRQWAKEQLSRNPEDLLNEDRSLLTKGVHTPEEKRQFTALRAALQISFLANEDPKIRRTALDDIEDLLEDEECVKQYMPKIPVFLFLQDPDPSVQKEAMKVLLRMPITAKTLEALLFHPDRQFQKTALALMVENRERGVPFLEDAVARPMLPHVMKALENADGDIAVLACRVLAKYREPSSADAIAKLLENPRPETRRAAAEALLGIGNPSNVQKLVPLLFERNVYVSGAAAKAITKHGNADTAALVIAHYEKTEMEWIPHEAVSVLSDLNAASSVPELKRLLGSPKPAARGAAVRALGMLKEKSSAEDMLKLLKDENPKVRQAAIYGIRALKDNSLLEPIAELLQDPSPGARIASASSLSMDRAYADRVARLLEDPDPDTRIAAMQSLRVMKAVDFAGKIAERIEDRNPNVCHTAIDELIQLEGRRAVPRLAPLLDHPDRKMQEAVARVFERLSGENWLSNNRIDQARQWAKGQTSRSE